MDLYHDYLENLCKGECLYAILHWQPIRLTHRGYAD